MDFKDGVSGRDLQSTLLVPLIQAEFLSGTTFVITSAIRLVGSHRDGLTVDIRCRSDEQRFLIVASLLQVGFTRLRLYDKHVHVSADKSRSGFISQGGISK